MDPLPIGLMKINVDVALAKNSVVVVAATVARDAARKFLGASGVVMEGRMEPKTVEAIACKEGLALASDLVLRDFRLSCDNAEVIRTFEKGPWALMDILFRKLELDHAISISLILFMKEGDQILMPMS